MLIKNKLLFYTNFFISKKSKLSKFNQIPSNSFLDKNLNSSKENVLLTT
jgi:hypothetical protein